MPGSTTVQTSGITGLSIRAWALIEWNGATATLVRGFNVASVARSAIGKYTLTLSAAMANATVVPQIVAMTDADASSAWTVSATGTTTTVVTANPYLGTVAADPKVWWVGVSG